MALLNYTTDVPASRSIGQVQGMLVEAGARAIASEYSDDGRITGMRFAVETQFGMQTFHLPVHSERVLAVLKRDFPKSKKYGSLEQAERVAWRITKDWIEAQLAIIQTEMVSLDQVMLPYMQVEGDKTMYELFVTQQKALPSA